MDGFTKTVIGVTVFFILFYYYRQWQNYKEEQAKLTWPTSISPCPDYWVHEGNGQCKNPFKVGKCPTRQDGQVDTNSNVNFNTDYYRGEQGILNKCRWAKRCNAAWEGIDNMCA